MAKKRETAAEVWTRLNAEEAERRKRLGLPAIKGWAESPFRESYHVDTTIPPPAGTWNKPQESPWGKVKTVSPWTKPDDAPPPRSPWGKPPSASMGATANHNAPAPVGKPDWGKLQRDKRPIWRK